VVVDISDPMQQGFQQLRLDGLIVVNGDGTPRIADELVRRFRLPIVAVPKSIDNDLAGTDVNFGFDTAVGTATEALDRLHTTAESHHRAMVLELVGRDSGFIALHAGVAGDSDAILIREIPFDIEVVGAKVRERGAGRRRAKLSHAWRRDILPATGRHWTTSRRRDRASDRQGDQCDGAWTSATRRVAHLIAGWPRVLTRARRGWRARAAGAAWWVCAGSRLWMRRWPRRL
jgi:Phosphofructokinase